MTDTHTQDGGWEERFYEKWRYFFGALPALTAQNTNAAKQDILSFIHQEITAAEERERSGVFAVLEQLRLKYNEGERAAPDLKIQNSVRRNLLKEIRTLILSPKEGSQFAPDFCEGCGKDIHDEHAADCPKVRLGYVSPKENTDLAGKGEV